MHRSRINSPDDLFPLGPKVRIKVCGITNLHDALHCADLGVEMLGFNFYRRSPRFIETDTARAIIDELPDSIIAVGVFVNEPSPVAVLETAGRSGIGAIQLHGEESPEFCEALTGRPLIKAFRVRPGFDPAETSAYQNSAILLDGFAIQEHGGTGHSFNWSVTNELPATVTRLFLAGGLGVDNVAHAIATVRPYAVDACSRLEQIPGVKDRSLVAKFVQEVRRIEVNA